MIARLFVASCCTLVLLTAVGRARAQAPAPASASDEAPPPPYLEEPPSAGIWPAHRAEWLHGTDAISLFAPAVAPALGLGLEAARAFDLRQRHRAGVHLGALLAADPRTQRAVVHLWPGLRYRYSFHMDDLFDWYALARLDFPVGGAPWRAGALSPGAGVGVRLARTAAIEASLMSPFGMFGPIELDGRRHRVWGAFGVSITVDLCRIGVDCERAPPRQRTRDCTNALYERAQQTCELADATQHAQLCQAVMEALDGAAHPPSQGEDSTSAFLRTLLAELGSAPERAQLAESVQALQREHDAWQRMIATQRAAARTADQQERTLRYFTSYAPSAVELRRVLGCYPQPGAARCPAIEDPSPSRRPRPARKPTEKPWTCAPPPALFPPEQP